jgi:hypothetical protein
VNSVPTGKGNRSIIGKFILWQPVGLALLRRATNFKEEPQCNGPGKAWLPNLIQSPHPRIHPYTQKLVGLERDPLGPRMAHT